MGRIYCILRKGPLLFKVLLRNSPLIHGTFLDVLKNSRLNLEASFKSEDFIGTQGHSPSSAQALGARKSWIFEGCAIHVCALCDALRGPRAASHPETLMLTQPPKADPSEWGQ